jgi:hypothetical protein
LEGRKLSLASFVRRVAPGFALALSVLAGCGGGGASLTDASGDGPADASAASPDGARGEAADVPTHDSPAAANGAPGRFLTSQKAAGAGSCSGKTLADVIAAIHALDPSLADIVAIYNPADGTSDGSFIYAYARGDGGFDVVLRRGQGDCPAGCTDNEYFYFSTDGGCRPQKVGHYRAAWGTGSGCLEVEGAPMWNHPPSPDPLLVCGEDNEPAALSGTYRLRAVGQRSACALAGKAKPSAIDATVTVVVKQDAREPSVGTVTFSGTGHGLIDGVPLPAQFQRKRFDAELKATNAPSSCPRESTVTARFDFEGYQAGGIELGELGNEACEACKGSMSLTLTQ